MENETLNTTVSEQPAAPETPAVTETEQPAVESAAESQPQTEEHPAEGKPAKQTPEENAHFAAARRQKEAVEKEDAIFRQLIGDVQNPETGKPFANKDEFITWKRNMEIRQRAQAAQLTPEVYKEIEERIREDVKRTDPNIVAQAQELQSYRQAAMQSQFESDIKAIRKAYPDEKAKRIEDLGLDFMRLCASGITPIVAYEAVRNEKARTAKPQPSMGDVKTAPAHEKDFYTREEVAAMSQADVSKHFDAIRKSQMKW